MTYLSHFHHIRPDFELEQTKALQWIASAHAQTEKHLEIAGVLSRIGAGPDKIQKRGVVFQDFFHQEWDKMAIYQLDRHPEGLGLKERMQLFEEVVDNIFEQFYPPAAPLPSHLIHVTCTGYVSPSGAQKLVSNRKKGSETTVTHAYHMGCYASLPALRIGRGYDSPVDIIHTELCSLHLNPSLHGVEQLVVQTLFGDGFIKYSLSSQRPSVPHFEILSLREEIIPDSIQSMSWRAENWGFRMTLAKDLPFSIAQALPGFMERLTQESLSSAFFAIHPGGPKIIQQVGKALGLAPEQYLHSQGVLRDFGNMSSATLPHVWQRMLEDKTIPEHALIVSLAFGPGLTLSGGVFRKCGG